MEEEEVIDEERKCVISDRHLTIIMRQNDVSFGIFLVIERTGIRDFCQLKI